MTSVPIVAAINGACAGVGLMLALQSDIRFVSQTARLATSFSRRGMIAEQEMAWLLTTIVGRGRASDLLLSGRTITGADALTYGLADFAVPADEVLASALAYAADMAVNCSPRATAAIKKQLAQAPSSSCTVARGVGQRLALEAFDWPDFAEGAGVVARTTTPGIPGILDPHDIAGETRTEVRWRPRPEGGGRTRPNADRWRRSSTLPIGKGQPRTSSPRIRRLPGFQRCHAPRLSPHGRASQRTSRSNAQRHGSSAWPTLPRDDSPFPDRAGCSGASRRSRRAAKCSLPRIDLFTQVTQERVVVDSSPWRQRRWRSTVPPAAGRRDDFAAMRHRRMQSVIANRSSGW